MAFSRKKVMAGDLKRCEILPGVPDRIVTTFDLRHDRFVLVVDMGLIISSIATTFRRHLLMRRFRMAEKKCLKTVKQFQEKVLHVIRCLTDLIAHAFEKLTKIILR